MNCIHKLSPSRERRNRYLEFPCVLALVFTLMFCVACDQPAAPTKPQNTQTLEKQIAELKEKVDKLDGDTKRVELALDQQKNQYSSIVIDPSVKGYERIDTTAGSFLVMLKDIQPYADGYKLKLSIGNISSAEYSGFALTATWHKSYAKYTSEDWSKGGHEKTFNYPEKLLPGSWNTVSLILSPAQKEELEYIEISMSTNQIMLIAR